MAPFLRSVTARLSRAPAHRKVALLAGTLLLLMVVVSAVGVLSVRSMNRDLAVITAAAVPAGLALAEADEGVVSAQLALEQSESPFTGEVIDVSRLDEVERGLAEVDAAYARYRDLRATGTPEHVRFEEALATWRARVLDYVRALRNGEPASAEAQLVIRARYEAVHDEIDALMAANEAALMDVEERSIERGETARTLLLVTAALGVLAGLAISRSSYRAAQAQHRELGLRDVARERESARRSADARINQSLEQIQTEEDAVATVALALEEMLPARASELLLADSSNAHLHVVSATRGFDARPGCGVPTPRACPAVSKSRTLTFATSESFDACPHLRNRSGPPSSAVCVPVAINGAASGVLHSITDAHAEVEADEQRLLEVLASRAGDRIGVLRAFSRSETQAATDSLTGLDNRRSFENRASELLAGGRSLSLAFGDLDRFKQLNDLYGHDAGDRALRAFARTLRQAVRPDDLVARWGGEEFVVAFPDTSREVAASVLERVRAELARVAAAGGIPTFTVSFGVSDGFDGDDVSALVEAADRALLRAKELGRDRVVVSGDPDADPPPRELARDGAPAPDR